MPPNTRAGPMQYPQTPFFPSGAAGTRWDTLPLPSGVVWIQSAQPHPVQQDVGLFTSQLAVPHPRSALHPSPDQISGLSLSRLLNTGPGSVPSVTPWECVLAVPRLALDKGWREEVRKNLGLTKGLGIAWEVLLAAAASKLVQLSQLVCCTLVFCCADFAAPCRKASGGNSNRGCKAQLAKGLMQCNYSPYNSLYSFDNY